MSKSQRERMLNGELYVADDPELETDAARCDAPLRRYNATVATEVDERRRILEKLLGGIGQGVWLGGGVIVLPGVTIGRDSVVGAGAVVTKDLPPRVVAAGNPTRVIREL